MKLTVGLLKDQHRPESDGLDAASANIDTAGFHGFDEGSSIDSVESKIGPMSC